MKQFKFLILAALTLVSVTARSQEKTEVQYTPKSGSYALSISGIPMSQYIGQFFNGTAGNNLAEFGGQAYIGGDINTNQFRKIAPLMSISGKYFLDKETALRVNLGLIYQRTFTEFYSADDADRFVNPFSQQKVIDTRLQKNTGMSLMAGLEKRAGKERLQGIYGAGVLFAMNTLVRKYTYGNAITDINQNPTTSNGGGVAPMPGFASNRLLKDYNLGATLHAGIVAFVGVEYFIIPKMSIGGEVNFTALASFDQAQYQDLEGFSTVDVARKEWTELTAPSSNQITIGTGNVGANVTLNFYF